MADMLQIFFSFLVLAFLAVQFTMRSNKRLPPGPPKLPIIGNMYQLTGTSPHRTLRDLALKYGPLMYLKLGSVPTIVASSAKVAREIMKTHDHVFASRPKLLSAKTLGYNYTDVALTPLGTYWKQLRKICITELLNAKRVESFRFVREEEILLLLRSVAAAGSRSEPVNIADALFAYNHDTTTRVAFGKKSDGWSGFKAAMREGMVLVAGFQVGDFFPSLQFVSRVTGMTARVQKNFVELDRILGKVIQQHLEKDEASKTEHEDLVDVLLRVMKSGELEVPLTYDNIKAVILDMFIGGTENGPNALEWAMAEMMRNPRIMERAQAEVRRVVGGKPTVQESDLPALTYMKLVIKEALRMHAPLPLLIPRESTEACTINGYLIPAKTRVFVNFWAISMDPVSWKDPERFYPERFVDSSVDFMGTDYEFVPFGAGRRICPGITYGVHNMELALAALLYHFDWKLPNNMKREELDMSEKVGLTMFKRLSLHLIPNVRFAVPARRSSLRWSGLQK